MSIYHKDIYVKVKYKFYFIKYSNIIKQIFFERYDFTNETLIFNVFRLYCRGVDRKSVV